MICLIAEGNKKLPDEYDKAIKGTCYETGVLMYSVELCLEVLIERQGLSVDGAIEHFDFNIGGAGGEGFPKFLYTEDLETLLETLKYSKED